VDGIGSVDTAEGRQRETIGDVGLEETELGAGKGALRSCAQGLQASPVPVDGDDCRVRARNAAERERERAASGTAIGPVASTVPLDCALDQLHVIGMVHQTTPLEWG
jgi:hypothetical protein